MRKRDCSLAACLLTVVSLASHADVIYVDARAVGEKDGRNWQNAFLDLQDALSSAHPGDEIWVAAGRYAPSLTDRGVSFELRSSVSLYGGFKGLESRRDDRDWEQNETVLLAEIGREGRHRDNIQRIVSAVDASDARVDGFVLNRAFNERDAPLGRGGAVYALGSDLTIANCRFERNRAGGGGAMWIEDSTVTVDNCWIRNNRNRAVTMNYSDVGSLKNHVRLGLDRAAPVRKRVFPHISWVFDRFLTVAARLFRGPM